MQHDPETTTDILDCLDETAEARDRVTIGNMMDAFGARSYGPFLLVPALIELSPLGAIPGVPTVLAAIILLFAVQIAVGRDHFWVPDLVERRSVPGGRLKDATGKLRPVARRLDRWFHGRLEWLTSRPFVQAAAVVCILLCLTVPPLELFPFASSGPMGAIALLGLALLVRDGALMVAALAVALAGGSIGLWFFLTGG